MLVTELGMIMFVRLVQFLNAETPIVVTEFGIVVFLHPAISLLEYF